MQRTDITTTETQNRAPIGSPPAPAGHTTNNDTGPLGQTAFFPPLLTDPRSRFRNFLASPREAPAGGASRLRAVGSGWILRPRSILSQGLPESTRSSDSAPNRPSCSRSRLLSSTESRLA